jgi:hypothetical protein
METSFTLRFIRLEALDLAQIPSCARPSCSARTGSELRLMRIKAVPAKASLNVTSGVFLPSPLSLAQRTALGLFPVTRGYAAATVHRDGSQPRGHPKKCLMFSGATGRSSVSILVQPF